MSGTLLGRVRAVALHGVVWPLVGVGAVTAIALHGLAHRALDQVLLAGAMSEAHPWAEQRWAPPGVHSPVRVRPVAHDDPAVPQRVHAEAERTRAPVFLTVGERRLVWLPVVPPDQQVLSHFVIAEADAVRLTASIGPFLAIYAAVATVAALAAAAWVSRSVGAAVAPLGEAAAAIDRVRSVGTDAALPVGGPDEVARVLVSVSDLLERLARASEGQSRFTAEAAHELRTPVTVLLGELELALRGDRTPDALRAAIGAAHAQATHLRELVDALMALARLDAGHADRVRELEHLSALVHQVLVHQGVAPSAMEVAFDADPEVHVDRPLVETAIANLVRNARVHGRPPLRLRVTADADRVHVDVDDSGPGVPEAQREALFERFARGDRRAAGLGLGLPLARQIARRHGGDVTLGAAPSGGTRARLTLPSASPAVLTNR